MKPNVIVHTAALPKAWKPFVKVVPSDRRMEELVKKFGGRAK